MSVVLFKSWLSELWIPPVPVAGVSQAMHVQTHEGGAVLEGKGKLSLGCVIAVP